MVLRTGYVRVQIGDTSLDYSISLTDHKWYQIVFRRDSGNLFSIGVNGTIGQTGSIPGAIDQQDGEIGGYRQDTSSSNWNGKIGECRFYNRALSDFEISKLYEYDKDLGPY